MSQLTPGPVPLEASLSDSFYARIAEQLRPEPHDFAALGCAKIDDNFAYQFDQPPRAAAVMVALVERESTSHRGVNVLYTKRAANLRDHSGQVSFPGGKIDAGDTSPFAAARREAHEEVALLPGDVNFLGYLPTYHTGTNFLVTPVVVHARPRAAFIASPGEVDDIFEVPLNHLMQNQSYQMIERRFPTQASDAPLRKTWRIEYEERQIWGITANITRMFYDRVLRELSESGGVDGV